MAPVYNSAQLYQPDAVPNPAGILPQFKTNTFDFTAFDNARLAQDAAAIMNKNNAAIADQNVIKAQDAQSQAATDEQIKQALVDKYSGTAGTEPIDQAQAIDSMVGQAISVGDADRAIKLIQAQATIEQKNSMAAARKQQELLNAEKTKDLRDPAWRIIEQNTAAVTPGTYEANVTPQGNAQPSQGGPSVEFSRKALDLQPGEKTIPQDIADSYRQNLIATRDPDAAKAAQTGYARMINDQIGKDREKNLAVYQSGQAFEGMANKAREGLSKLYDTPSILPPNMPGRGMIDAIEQIIPFGDVADNASKRIAGRSILDTLKPDALRADFVRGIGALSDKESQAFFSKSTSSDNTEAANRELTAKMEQASQMQAEYANARSLYMMNRQGDSRGFDEIWNAYKQKFPLIIQDKGTGEWVANMGRPKLADLPIDALTGPTSVMNSGQSQNKLPSNADGSPLTREQFNALMGGK